MPSAFDTSVDIKITLGSGKEITPFNSLTISQSIVQHHTFEVRCYHEVFEQSTAKVISATQNIVGQDISISLKPMGGGPETHFKGIVTEVGMVQGDGISHEIIIKGFSSTIKLESGPKLKVFLDKNVKDIVSEICSAAGVKKTGNIKFNQVFKYCAQFNESNFQFLRRLAAIHGEWFYYDGTNLVFGEPSTLSTVKFEYLKDLMTLSMSMGAAPLQFKDFSFNSGYDGVAVKTFNGSAPGAIDGADAFGQKMTTASKNIFPDKFNFMPRQVANDQAGLENFNKSFFNSIGGGMVHIHASGDNPSAAIGTIADISTEDGASYGKFLITSITHHSDGMGNYTNNFTGIPSTLKTLPNPYIHKPNADSEIAKVTDNADPDKQGRVRVKFMWMESEQTWWIPTTQLYGGGSDFKNRGTVFIPEIDDEVIIAFERGDCDKPYVTQSLMNSKAVKPKQNDNSKNAKKIISTRDNRLSFRDKGDGSDAVGIALKVYNGDNKPKAYIGMLDHDSKVKLLLNAIDEVYITTNGVEVSLKMEKDGTIKIMGKNITVEAQETITLKGKDIVMEATNNISLKSNADTKLEAMGNINIKATQKLSAAANADVAVSGLNVNLTANVSASLKGNATAELSASGQTVVKGGIVMIN